MKNAMNILLLMGDQVLRIGAFVYIFYYIVVLYRRRLQGAPFLLFGFIAVLIGDFSKMASFTGIWQGGIWLPALILTALGYCLAAYGFAKLVQAIVRDR
jgi:hypothetical protein